MQVGEALEAGDPRRAGRYEIVARLGAGGMGRVYLGRSPGGRAMAIKVVRPDLADDEQFRRRFAREVAAARRVNGVFTAAVVDADPEARPPWLATAYVPGVSLDKAVALHGPWALAPALALAAGLAEALEAIHAAGVVHRDLKPANVMLSADGPRVIDFGISVAGDASALTGTGLTFGTPGFMAPEQVRGQQAGPACDVFSLGAVLAWTATGKSPFGSGTPLAVNFRAVYEEPDLSALPAGLHALVRDCLAKDPDRRPGVAEVLERVTAALGRRPAELALPERWLPAPVADAVRTSTAQARTEPALAEPAPPSGSASASGAGSGSGPDPGPRTLPRPDGGTGGGSSPWLRRSVLGFSALVSVAALVVSAVVYANGQREDRNGGAAGGSGPVSPTSPPPASTSPSPSAGPGPATVRVVTFEDGPIRSSPSRNSERLGTLTAGPHEVFCRAQGATVTEDGVYNSWWLWTRVPGTAEKGWVSAYYLHGDDRAEAADGSDVPDCGQVAPL
ncbi:serine/threonine protein kinase [Streptomyces sp. NRRL S-87]|uniref:serine/threonine protein kinase n=1 Tax=Streptomyces sp. NRRL S-87 TaxID=1463920 RepID=UPI00068A917A|nr:serine/threonine protein kinase [Streptomyces sp. NRRL S-87]